MVQMLHNITNSTGANSNQDCIDAVDEWQVTESLYDPSRGPDALPYPLIDGHELFGGIEQDDGSLYLGGVNDGRGLGRWNSLPQFIFLTSLLLDAELEGKLDEMEELDEFEPGELQGALVFSEDEDMVDPEEKDDW
jgi:hypothetical protein